MIHVWEFSVMELGYIGGTEVCLLKETHLGLQPLQLPKYRGPFLRNVKAVEG